MARVRHMTTPMMNTTITTIDLGPATWSVLVSSDATGFKEAAHDRCKA